MCMWCAVVRRGYFLFFLRLLCRCMYFCWKLFAFSLAENKCVTNWLYLLWCGCKMKGPLCVCVCICVFLFSLFLLTFRFIQKHTRILASPFYYVFFFSSFVWRWLKCTVSNNIIYLIHTIPSRERERDLCFSLHPSLYSLIKYACGYYFLSLSCSQSMMAFPISVSFKFQNNL